MSAVSTSHSGFEQPFSSGALTGRRAAGGKRSTERSWWKSILSFLAGTVLLVLSAAMGFATWLAGVLAALLVLASIPALLIVGVLALALLIQLFGWFLTGIGLGLF